MENTKILLQIIEHFKAGEYYQAGEACKFLPKQTARKISNAYWSHGTQGAIALCDRLIGRI